jgi:hypothetical protein
VVDQWVSNVESSSPHDFLLRHDLWTTFRHLLWSQITSATSMAWDFTTKSGGMWLFRHALVPSGFRLQVSRMAQRYPSEPLLTASRIQHRVPRRTVAPHPAQAACLTCRRSDSTPVDRCPKVTFTRTGIQLFPWMSARLLVGETRPPATSAPFQVRHRPIRRVVISPCLSAAGLRFLAVLSHWSLSATLRRAYCPRQTPVGFPRSA